MQTTDRQGDLFAPIPFRQPMSYLRRMKAKLAKTVPLNLKGRFDPPNATLKRIIEAHGESVSSLAKAIGMDRASLSLAVNGAPKGPQGKPYPITLDLAHKIAARFGDDAGDLLILAIRKWEDQEGEAARADYRKEIAAHDQ